MHRKQHFYIHFAMESDWIDHRQWRPTPYGVQFNYNKHSQAFVVMTYNILAQDLVGANAQLYTNCDPFTLRWNHRLRCLKQEIEKVRPSILCLQEVQENHLDEIVYALHELRFAPPLFKKRNGGQSDGCAIFFNQYLFELIDYHFVEYFQPDIPVSKSNEMKCNRSQNFFFFKKNHFYRF